MQVLDTNPNDYVKFICGLISIVSEAMNKMRKITQNVIETTPEHLINAFIKFKTANMWYWSFKADMQELNNLSMNSIVRFLMDEMHVDNIYDFNFELESVDQIINIAYKNLVKKKNDFTYIASRYPELDINPYLDDLEAERIIREILIKAQHRRWSMEKMRKEIRNEFSYLRKIGF